MTDTSVELELAPSDASKEMWDNEFLCTFTVSLEEDQLATNMLVENKGEESFDFQAALHSYFTASSLKDLEISGSFAGKEFLNKLVGDEGEMQTENRDVITIAEEYDRVYMGVNDPVLKDAGTGKSLMVLNEAGWEDTVIWNPYGNEAMGYDNFVWYVITHSFYLHALFEFGFSLSPPRQLSLILFSILSLTSKCGKRQIQARIFGWWCILGGSYEVEACCQLRTRGQILAFINVFAICRRFLR